MWRQGEGELADYSWEMLLLEEGIIKEMGLHLDQCIVRGRLWLISSGELFYSWDRPHF